VYCGLAKCRCLVPDMLMGVLGLGTQRCAIRPPAKCIALGFTCGDSGKQMKYWRLTQESSSLQPLQRSEQLQLSMYQQVLTST